jgi:hypothetical protein
MARGKARTRSAEPEQQRFALATEQPRPRKRAVRDGNAEARRQAAIVDFVRWVAPDIVIFHVPNGGLRTKSEAARLKWVGTLAGVLDLVLVLPRGGTAFWETKVPKTGRLSDDQKDMIAALERLGHVWAIVRDIDDARRELERLGVVTREVKTGPLHF